MTGACVVPIGKVRDYLLNPDHRDGGPKCAFFEAHGFLRARHEVLAEALVEHFESNVPSTILEMPYGRKYIVRGMLKAADGRRPMVQTIWIVLAGDDRPIFVTAVPRKSDTETV